MCFCSFKRGEGKQSEGRGDAFDWICETCRDKSVLLLKMGIRSYAGMLLLLPYPHFTPPLTLF